MTHLTRAIDFVIDEQTESFWQHTKYLGMYQLKSQDLLRAVLLSSDLDFIKEFLNKYHVERKIMVQDDLFECMISFCNPEPIEIVKPYISNIILNNIESVFRSIFIRLERLYCMKGALKKFKKNPFMNLKTLSDFDVTKMLIKKISEIKTTDFKFQKYLGNNLLVELDTVSHLSAMISGEAYFEYILKKYGSSEIFKLIKNDNASLKEKIDSHLNFIKARDTFEAKLKQHETIHCSTD
jgi:hypothetical protein